MIKTHPAFAELEQIAKEKNTSIHDSPLIYKISFTLSINWLYLT